MFEKCLHLKDVDISKTFNWVDLDCHSDHHHCGDSDRSSFDVKR